MTEDQARTKWCPFARQMVSINQGQSPIALASANRFDGDQVAMCLGSGCMAWRETEGARSGAWVGGEQDPPRPARGYCGLAGAPT